MLLKREQEGEADRDSKVQCLNEIGDYLSYAKQPMVEPLRARMSFKGPSFFHSVFLPAPRIFSLSTRLNPAQLDICVPARGKEKD